MSPNDMYPPSDLNLRYSQRYHERFNDDTSTPVLDKIIPTIFEIMDTYYDAWSDNEIRKLLAENIESIREELLRRKI